MKEKYSRNCIVWGLVGIILALTLFGSCAFASSNDFTVFRTWLTDLKNGNQWDNDTPYSEYDYIIFEIDDSNWTCGNYVYLCYGTIGEDLLFQKNDNGSYTYLTGLKTRWGGHYVENSCWILYLDEEGDVQQFGSTNSYKWIDEADKRILSAKDIVYSSRNVVDKETGEVFFQQPLWEGVTMDPILEQVTPIVMKIVVILVFSVALWKGWKMLLKALKHL